MELLVVSQRSHAISLFSHTYLFVMFCFILFLSVMYSNSGLYIPISVAARKEGLQLKEDIAAPGHFQALKLAQIEVRVRKALSLLSAQKAHILHTYSPTIIDMDVGLPLPSFLRKTHTFYIHTANNISPLRKKHTFYIHTANNISPLRKKHTFYIHTADNISPLRKKHMFYIHTSTIIDIADNSGNVSLVFIYPYINF